MKDPREEKFEQITRQFPDSPMGHYSLGRYYLEQGRFQEAIPALEQAAQLDAAYAAALVCLGDAYAGAALEQKARATWEQAKEVALSQKHEGLAEEIQLKLDNLL